jgi:hypothetical protein
MNLNCGIIKLSFRGRKEGGRRRERNLMRVEEKLRRKFRQI